MNATEAKENALAKYDREVALAHRTGHDGDAQACFDCYGLTSTNREAA